MAKICITVAFICFTLLVLPELSSSRYLLVDLDGSPDMAPGMNVTTVGPEMPEPEEEPIDNSEPETLPEDDEEGVIPEQEQKPTNVGYRGRSLNLNLTQSLNATGYRICRSIECYRSSI